VAAEVTPPGVFCEKCLPEAPGRWKEEPPLLEGTLNRGFEGELCGDRWAMWRVLTEMTGLKALVFCSRG